MPIARIIWKVADFFDGIAAWLDDLAWWFATGERP